MTKKTADAKGLTYFYRMIAAAALIWTVTVVGSASWNAYNERQQTLELIKKEALANFNKDLAFRLWGTKHGGVYVPSTAQTPPNPYLGHIPDRDITLPSGKRLTLMNPAYMLRQMMFDFGELYGIRGRITSLKPLNPANMPDAWEREALAAFERGEKEFVALTEHDGQQSLRLMRPMVTQAGCLKCHAHQGYREGDVRGGVGVNVPMAPYLDMEKKSIGTILLSHLVIWLLGSTVLSLVFFRGKRFILEQVKSAEELVQSEEFVSSIIDNIPDMVFVKDAADLRFVRFNKAGERLLAYSKEELIGKNDYDFFPKDEADFFTMKDREVFSNNRLIEIQEESIKTRHGDERILHTKKLPILDKEGNPLYLLGISEDITERKQVEEELRNNEQHSQSLLRLSKKLELAQTSGEVLEAARDEVRTVIGYQDLWAYIFTEGKQYAKILVAGGPRAKTLMSEDGAATLSIKGDRMLEEIAEAKEIVVVEDARADVRTNKEIVARLGNRTIVNVPIILMDRHLGSVGTGTFGDEGVRVPTKPEQRYLSALASHLAVALDRIHLLAERRKSEEELMHYRDRLETLVKERTAELDEKNRELEHFNKLFVNRELKMIELKKRIKELESKQ